MAGIKASHPDIHIEYPTPKGFLSGYSTGIGNKWIVSIGRIHDLIQNIQNSEREKYLKIT